MRLQDSMIGVLRHAGRSEATQKNYCREVQRFLDWLGDNRPLRADREDVVSYLEHMGDQSVGCRKMAHAGLRFFYVHVVDRPEVVAGIPWPSVGRSLRSGPCWSEVRQLLRAVEDPVCRGALCVISGSGLRISEACSLRVEDVEPLRDEYGRKLDRGVLVVRGGKGDKERLSPLPPTLLLTLRRYFVAVRPLGYLFPNQGDAPSLVELRLAAATARVDTTRPFPRFPSCA
jgi:integrase